MQAKRAEKKAEARQPDVGGILSMSQTYPSFASSNYYVSTSTTPATYTSASTLTASPPNLAGVAGLWTPENPNG